MSRKLELLKNRKKSTHRIILEEEKEQGGLRSETEDP